MRRQRDSVSGDVVGSARTRRLHGKFMPFSPGLYPGFIDSGPLWGPARGGTLLAWCNPFRSSFPVFRETLGMKQRMLVLPFRPLVPVLLGAAAILGLVSCSPDSNR